MNNKTPENHATSPVAHNGKRGQRGKRRWTWRIGVSALVALACGLILEGSLRFGLIPNERQQRIAAERFWKSARRRVMILGDSFFQPRGAAARLVADGLAADDIATHNLAVSGTGPFEYAESFVRSTKEPQPDVVLLGYYVGNDLTDVQDNPMYRPDATGLAIRTNLPVEQPVELGEWYEQLYVLDFLRSRPRVDPDHVHQFNWGAFERAGIPSALIEDAKVRRINPWLMELALRNPDHLLENILIETEENQRAWTMVEEIMTRLRRLCGKRGIKLLVVVFPRSIEVNRSHFEFFEQLKFRVDERTLESTRPQDLMRELCTRLETPVLDLLPFFLERADEDLFLEKDDHLNAAGNQLAAEQIIPFVRAHIDE